MLSTGFAFKNTTPMLQTSSLFTFLHTHTHRLGFGDLPFADVKVFVTIYVLAGLAIVANIMNDVFNEMFLVFL